MSGDRPIQNFGGNVLFNPTARYQPRDEAEVLQILDNHRGQTIRVAGRLHSWSDVARADDVYLDLGQLSHVSIEEQHGDEVRAVIGAGSQIKHVLAELRRQANVTSPTVGLIDEQTIAGAISTGTHGSGKHSLSHYIDEVRVACYDAETGQAIVKTVRQGDDLRAARCSLGTMGVILSVTLRCRAPYRVEEHSRRYDTLQQVLDQEERFPLQQFFLMPWLWCYFAQHRRETTSRRSRLAPLYRLFWFWGIDVGLHLIICMLARVIRGRSAIEFFFRRLVPWFTVRRWVVVDRAEDMLTMQHELFRHIEIEIFVSREHLRDAADYIKDVVSVCAGRVEHVAAKTEQQLEQIDMLGHLRSLTGEYVHHYPITFRKILRDDTLISMASGDTDYYSISFISYQRHKDRYGFFRFATFLANSMARLFQARAHWGKFNPLDRETNESLYPRLADFRSICRRYDPDGAFRNDWITAALGLDEGRATALPKKGV